MRAASPAGNIFLGLRVALLSGVITCLASVDHILPKLLHDRTLFVAPWWMQTH